MAKRPLEWHFAADERQLAQRRAMKDNLEVPREVDHFAYFGRKSNAELVAELLRGEGFTVALSRTGLRTQLAAHRPSPVDPATVTAFVTGMFHTVEAHGGTYDGWGGWTRLDAFDSIGASTVFSRPGGIPPLRNTARCSRTSSAR